MGIGNIGIWQLLIILAVVILLFGTKKIRSLGSDLGGALKGFRSAMKEEDKDKDDKDEDDPEKLNDTADDATKEENAAKRDKSNTNADK